MPRDTQIETDRHGHRNTPLQTERILLTLKRRDECRDRVRRAQFFRLVRLLRSRLRVFRSRSRRRLSDRRYDIVRCSVPAARLLLICLRGQHDYRQTDHRRQQEQQNPARLGHVEKTPSIPPVCWRGHMMHALAYSKQLWTVLSDDSDPSRGRGKKSTK